MSEEFFTADDIADLRKVAEGNMDQLSDWYAPPTEQVKGEEAAATYPGDWTLVASAVPCHYDPAISRPQEGLTAGKPISTADGTITIAVSNTFLVESEYRVRITSMNDLDFEVTKEVFKSNPTKRRIEVKQVK